MARVRQEQGPVSRPAVRGSGRSAPPVPWRPMLLGSAAAAFDSAEYQFEIKWDGTRCCASTDLDGRLRLTNRRGSDVLGRYPELRTLGALPAGTLIDGEVVVLRGGRAWFAGMLRREQARTAAAAEALARRLPAAFVAFDLPWCRGEDRTGAALSERRRGLEALLASPPERVLLTDAVVGRGAAYFAAAERAGLEGIVAKRLKSVYRPGERSDDWLKIKVSRIETFAVIGYAPRDDRSGVSALLLGERRGELLGKRVRGRPGEAQGNAWRLAGKVGSGLTEPQRRELLVLLERQPPMDPPENAGDLRGVVFTRPALRAVVRYLERTDAGRLRGPVLVGLSGGSA